MSDRIEKLEALGCDVKGAMERFLDDEDFYFECYSKVLDDPCFEKLKEALEKHDMKAGFDCAHTLKGVIANLGLTSLYNIVVRIVEPLRAGTDEGIMDIYQELLQEREKYKAL